MHDKTAGNIFDSDAHSPNDYTDSGIITDAVHFSNLLNDKYPSLQIDKSIEQNGLQNLARQIVPLWHKTTFSYHIASYLSWIMKGGFFINVHPLYLDIIHFIFRQHNPTVATLLLADITAYCSTRLNTEALPGGQLMALGNSLKNISAKKTWCGLCYSMTFSGAIAFFIMLPIILTYLSQGADDLIHDSLEIENPIMVNIIKAFLGTLPFQVFLTGATLLGGAKGAIEEGAEIQVIGGIPATASETMRRVCNWTSSVLHPIPLSKQYTQVDNHKEDNNETNVHIIDLNKNRPASLPLRVSGFFLFALISIFVITTNQQIAMEQNFMRLLDKLFRTPIIRSWAFSPSMGALVIYLSYTVFKALSNRSSHLEPGTVLALTEPQQIINSASYRGFNYRDGSLGQMTLPVLVRSSVGITKGFIDNGFPNGKATNIQFDSISTAFYGMLITVMILYIPIGQIVQTSMAGNVTSCIAMSQVLYEIATYKLACKLGCFLSSPLSNLSNSKKNDDDNYSKEIQQAAYFIQNGEHHNDGNQENISNLACYAAFSIKTLVDVSFFFTISCITKLNRDVEPQLYSSLTSIVIIKAMELAIQYSNSSILDRIKGSNERLPELIAARFAQAIARNGNVFVPINDEGTKIATEETPLNQQYTEQEIHYAVHSAQSIFKKALQAQNLDSQSSGRTKLDADYFSEKANKRLPTINIYAEMFNTMYEENSPHTTPKTNPDVNKHLLALQAFPVGIGYNMFSGVEKNKGFTKLMETISNPPAPPGMGNV